MPNDLDIDQVRALAAEIGLTRLADEHLQQLLRATRAARSRRTSLRVESLLACDEPAHVYRLGEEIVR